MIEQPERPPEVGRTEHEAEQTERRERGQQPGGVAEKARHRGPQESTFARPAAQRETVRVDCRGCPRRIHWARRIVSTQPAGEDDLFDSDFINELEGLVVE